jgi:1,2-diacylglycerol 3-beta-glucosyltransferase
MIPRPETNGSVARRRPVAGVRRPDAWRHVAVHGALVLVAGTTAFAALGSAHLTVLMLSALLRAHKLSPPPDDGSHRLLVVIPAHDEEEILGETLAALTSVDYPLELVDVVVIADNCRDRTSDVAADNGARVLIRNDTERRGKGQALQWALEQLASELSSFDAVVFLDADCRPTRNLLSALAAHTAAGEDAVQAAYLVDNPEASWSAALRWAAFALMNFVRPLGRSGLGLSCAILGTGFALTPRLLQRCPWGAVGLTEDAEYHLRLVAAGSRVAFADEAAVMSPMPLTLRAAREQQLRWESGKWQLVREWSPRLVREGIRRRDARAFLTGIEIAIPSQSLLAAGNLAGIAAGLALRASPLVWLGTVGSAAQAAYVIGGQIIARAPRPVWRAMPLAPALVAWNLAIAGRLAARHGPTSWVGTREHRPVPDRDRTVRG